MDSEILNNTATDDDSSLIDAENESVGSGGDIVEPEPEPTIWDELRDEFLAVYPEFEPLFEGESESVEKNKKRFEAIMKKVSCLYPEFKDLERCQFKLPFFMLVAHNAVVTGFGTPLGILAQNGLVASSSVGGVSISYQGSPYSSKGDEFTYWLSMTPYGKEYLAWLARQAGLTYVN